MAEIFNELIPLTEKPKELFKLKIFITANNHELGSRFHLSTAKTYIDAFIKLLSYLIYAFNLKF